MERSAAAISQARLAAIVESSDEAIIAKNLDGVITDWNRAAEALFGYTAEEAVGRHIVMIAAPGREAEMAEILGAVTRGEKVDRIETERRHKDGRIVEILLTVSPIHDANGQVVGACKIAHDITGQRQARAKMALLAAIVASSQDAIISNDLNGVVTSWNPAAEALFGYAADEMLGRSLAALYPPDRQEEMHGILARIRRGEQVRHHDAQRRHKRGDIVHVSLTVSPILDETGRVIGASKIARSTGERRRAEERTLLLMRELDHRAKNVLAVAQAILRLTRADTLPEYISAVEGRVMALARIHTQVAENRWDGAELRALVTSCLEIFGDCEGRAGAEGPRVWLAPAAAQVVGVLLHELATNAAKHGSFSTPDGSIAVRWLTEPSGDLQLSWTESNGPPVRPPHRRSFGTRVIERHIPDQLGGQAEVRWMAEGLHCEFRVPAANVVDLRTRDDN